MDSMTITFKPCRVTILSHVISKLGKFVLIERHIPVPTVKWWRQPMPISEKRVIDRGKVRNLSYDLFLSSDEFSHIIQDLEESGVDLYFFEKEISATLMPSELPDSNRQQILRLNSCRAHFHLPHAYEVAVLACYSKELFEEIQSDPQLTPWYAGN